MGIPAPAGPLAGLRVVEFGAIGPVPFCGMLLADMGAAVLRLDRIEPRELGIGTDPRFDALGRGKRTLGVDLKQPAQVAFVLDLIGRADVLLEGYRPGVMERLGLGPEECRARNPRLVYGRMTGWSQSGPLASSAGHDINYIALSGALHAMGRADSPPAPPLALVGDFGGGAMMLAFGVACAVAEARRSGLGQVVDAAIVDGVNLLMAPFHGLVASGRWRVERAANALDGGAPWYDTYATQDGRFVAVGAIEERFYVELLAKLEIDVQTLPPRSDRAGWPVIRAALRRAFLTRTRDQWSTHFEGSDACVSPVLTITEAPHHPHAVARAAFTDTAGFAQPHPAPRFSRTPAHAPRPPPRAGDDTAALLTDWGIGAAAIAAFRTAGGRCDSGQLDPAPRTQSVNS